MRLILVSVLSIFLCSCSPKPKKVKIGISPWVENSQFKETVNGFKHAIANNYPFPVEYLTEVANANESKQEAIIQSFLNKKVDLIFSLSTQGTLIAKKLTERKKTPIVFSIVTFPVEAGIIDSFDDSKNNLVGTSNYIDAARQFYALESVSPNSKSIAFIHRIAEPNSVIQYKEFKQLLEQRSIQVLDIAANNIEELRSLLEAEKNNYDTLYAACDSLAQNGGEEIMIEIANKYFKPSFTCNSSGVKQGTLIGNIADYYQIGEMAGDKAVKILKGSEPSWLKTQYTQRNNIMINEKTLKHLGLTIPEDFAEEINTRF